MTAAADAQQFEQVMLLQASVGTAAPQATVPALGAAGTGGRALEALATDPELLAEERSRIRLLLVDDVHPRSTGDAPGPAVAAGTELTVLAGDPNQTVFGFRGADPIPCLPWIPRLCISLGRIAALAASARAVGGMASGLPGCRLAGIRWQRRGGVGERPVAGSVQ